MRNHNDNLSNNNIINININVYNIDRSGFSIFIAIYKFSVEILIESLFIENCSLNNGIIKFERSIDDILNEKKDDLHLRGSKFQT